MLALWMRTGTVMVLAIGRCTMICSPYPYIGRYSIMWSLDLWEWRSPALMILEGDLWCVALHKVLRSLLFSPTQVRTVCRNQRQKDHTHKRRGAVWSAPKRFYQWVTSDIDTTDDSLTKRLRIDCTHLVTYNWSVITRIYHHLIG
jgi:hypothetical protein